MFSQEGWKSFRRGGKILGGVQVICNMPFLMLWEEHEMANQSVPGGGGGVKHFLKGVKKNLGVLTPLTPPENAPMVLTCPKVRGGA